MKKLYSYNDVLWYNDIMKAIETLNKLKDNPNKKIEFSFGNSTACFKYSKDKNKFIFTYKDKDYISLCKREDYYLEINEFDYDTRLTIAEYIEYSAWMEPCNPRDWSPRFCVAIQNAAKEVI